MIGQRIIVPGEPSPKKRPRTFTTGGKIRTITPSATKKAEELIALYALKARWRNPVDGPVIMLCWFYITDKRVWRSDVDNLAKTVLDALEGICYTNDTNIMDLIARKRFRDDEPQTVIEVHPYESEEELLRAQAVLPASETSASPFAPPPDA